VAAIPAAYLLPVTATTAPSQEKPDAGPQNCRNGMVEITPSGLQSDVRPMPSMLFAVIYSGEQPGSAAGFAVISRLVWPESEYFRVGGGIPGCSFAVLTAISATAVRFLHSSGSVKGGGGGAVTFE
jgi:hypothetical protein